MIEQVQRDLGVEANLAVPTDVIPKLFADFRRQKRVGHPRAEMGTAEAIDGFRGENRLAADAAS